MPKFIDVFIDRLRNAAPYNSEVQAPPACILWPDKERQWESILPRLKEAMPELFVLGDYQPEEKTGPSIWLRCVISNTVPDYPLNDNLPILYLPGVSRQDLRAIEECPEHLKPLAELQYRGSIWSQVNNRDWSVMAFMKSNQGGLHLELAQDEETKSALKLALHRLIDEEISQFQGKRLDKDDFNTLLTGGDPIKDLLYWLDQGNEVKEQRTEPEWRGFVAVCKSRFGVHPEQDGTLIAAEKLARREGAWQAVWTRYCEAPRRYANIPELIRKCAFVFNIFDSSETAGGWPQWNDSQEQDLKRDLCAFENLSPDKASERLISLEEQHGERRELVWAELGEAPLALALKPLSKLAKTTLQPFGAKTLPELEALYTNQLWQADAAVLNALECAQDAPSYEAISAAIRSVYLPWLDKLARHLQTMVEQLGYPHTSETRQKHEDTEGECVLFVDGLRFDTGKMLLQSLSSLSFEIQEQAVWTALPSVTATGKAAVSPVADKISGPSDSSDFEPWVSASEKSLKGGYHFKKLLQEEGWQRLDKHETGDPQGKAWCEFGDIDHEGHDRGWKLAKHIPQLLKEITERVDELINAGWKQVRIVTDHGWLLMPGGLPKIDLPSYLTDAKWGRCAALKPESQTEEKIYPWFWNQNVYFALAEGIACYKKGEEYAHGGLTLQECLTLELMVRPDDLNQKSNIVLEHLQWQGLRCKVELSGEFKELKADLRTQPANNESSVAFNLKTIKPNGTVSLAVDDDELIGQSVYFVLVNAEGKIITQVHTVIGENND